MSLLQDIIAEVISSQKCRVDGRRSISAVTELHIFEIQDDLYLS
jgi:hypothetical protein